MAASPTTMPAPFPKWSNAAARAVLWGLAVLVVGIPAALMGWVRTPYMTNQDQPLEQPVAFDHRHHVVDDGIDCRYCHTSVEEAAPAGMPGADLCMNCHSQVYRDSPLLEPVRRSAWDDRPLAWVRVHRLPDFVFFDHSAHTRAGVGCESCHGRVDMMPRVRQVEPLTMGWCLDCHRNPAESLRPTDAVTEMGWRPEDGSRRSVGAALADARDVDPGTDCSTCHR